MRTILITGGAGFIGSHLAESLLMKGRSVVVADNFDEQYPPEIKRSNIYEASTNKLYKLYETDIRDEKGLGQIFINEKPDAVVHLAAYVSNRSSSVDHLEVMSNNAIGTKTLLEVCRKFNTPNVIVASSSSVYDDTPGVLSEDVEIGDLKSPYAISKLMVEQMARIYHSKFGMNVTALRIFNTYGPRQRLELVIPVFTMKIYNSEPIPVFGDGQAKYNFLYIEDCVTAIECAIDKQLGCEVINVAGNESISLLQLADIIAKSLSKEYEIIYHDNDLPESGSGIADLNKAKDLLGFGPKYDFKKGIKITIDYIIDNSKKNV